MVAAGMGEVRAVILQQITHVAPLLRKQQRALGWLAVAMSHGRRHARGRGDARKRWDGPRRCRCSGGWRVGPQRVGRGSPAAYTSQGLKSPTDTKQKKRAHPSNTRARGTAGRRNGARKEPSSCKKHKTQMESDWVFFFVFSVTCDMVNETHVDWATLATSRVGLVDTARVGGGSGDNQPSVASLSTAHMHTR